jgi:Lrp/AsnC family transcriptional regulator, leucine-responsive regulatory protein
MMGQAEDVVEVTALEVFECHRVTGERLLCDERRLPFIDDLEELADRFSPFGPTTTLIVNSTPVPRRGLLVQ